MERKSFNEVLKQREARKNQERMQGGSEDHMTLDDAQRVKVLSPGRLVFKRFIRNRLAIVGTCILIFMFLFSFVGALIYPYGQTERFYKYDTQNKDYANATLRTEFFTHGELPGTVDNRVNSAIRDIKAGAEFGVVIDDENPYVIRLSVDNIYTISPATEREVTKYSASVLLGVLKTVSGEVAYEEGIEPLGNGFYEAAEAALTDRSYVFEFDGILYELRNCTKIQGDIYKLDQGEFSVKQSAAFEAAATASVKFADENKFEIPTFSADNHSYYMVKEDKLFTAYELSEATPIAFSTTYVCNMLDPDGTPLPDDAFINALHAACEKKDSFVAGGTEYGLSATDGKEVISLPDGTPVAELTNFVVRGYDGKDKFDIAFKETVQGIVTEMELNGERSKTFYYDLPQREIKVDKDGAETLVFVKDEDGNQLYENKPLYVQMQGGYYYMTTPTLISLFDINGDPTPIKDIFGENGGKAKHLFGTDSDGYDVLARMMYGGRISLLVGFVVVILETILGTIMGGIAGYFGGWVDNIIMRLVDIFYCIPSMPILIIIASYMDFMKITPYVRLMWLMAILGILGWAGVARLVRGQILSLREQEFMVATEATGVRVSRRIFRHLVPNVMPQLIVTATAGLGSVILMEATLSFLGLGVKHPLATWGTMINSVTQRNEDMLKYAYIWVPVGLLICLTVIAFNFVGDGLRDAFDPKMKK